MSPPAETPTPPVTPQRQAYGAAPVCPGAPWRPEPVERLVSDQLEWLRLAAEEAKDGIDAAGVEHDLAALNFGEAASPPVVVHE